MESPCKLGQICIEIAEHTMEVLQIRMKLEA